MIECREVYILNQRQEEWDFIHEKHVACEEDFLVKIYQSYRDLQLIPGHYIWIFTSGIAFKCCNFLAPYLLRNFNILECHWTVLDLVAANQPILVIRRRIYECGV